MGAIGVKSYKPVSRILSWTIIYLSRQLLIGIDLPTLSRSRLSGIERAALRRDYTWHFSMQGLPANDVTIKSRELLPHVFIFSPITGVVIFCGTVCSRQVGTRLLTGALLCAVRTFLPPIKRETIAWLVAKI